MNILTVDVEDWYQLTGEQLAGQGTAQPDRVARQVDRVLDLLGNHDCRATFFCLGKSLEGAPQIVRRLAEAGHEIGTHGWGHEPVHRIGLARFREDLIRSIKWLEDLLGQSVKGYRAPAFSVPGGLLNDFYDICLEAGLAYDSSVFPIRGRRYGIPDAPLEPTVVRECDGRRLVELPLATLTWLGRRWPVAGGGYWRILPIPAIHAAVARINREGRPVVTYLHPYEFDTERLDAPGAAGRSWHAARRGFTQNLGRRSIYRKLESILFRHRFGAVEDYLDAAGYL
jgi:polysaccharide deacetylase family protein (PEP-CTERM system associated)